MCRCITYITKVNSDISMVRYYLLFLFLVERKKYVAVEQKIMEKKKKQHMHMHYKSNKSKSLYSHGDILPAVFIFTQKKNYVVLVEKQNIIEDKSKSACIFL